MYKEKLKKLPSSLIYTFLAVLLIWWIWNLVMPDLFGLPKITYWQMLGIKVMCELLFDNTSTKV